FVGPAEAFLATTCGFKSVNRALSFAFRKRTRPPQDRKELRPPQAKWELKARAKPIASTPPRDTALPLPAPVIVIPSDLSLAAAQTLADAGKLAEALAECEAHMKRHGGTADAYYLLGL